MRQAEVFSFTLSGGMGTHCCAPQWYAFSPLIALPLFEAACIDKSSAKPLNFFFGLLLKRLRAMVSMGITSMMIEGNLLLQRKFLPQFQSWKLPSPGGEHVAGPAKARFRSKEGSTTPCTDPATKDAHTYGPCMHHRHRPTQALLRVGNGAQQMIGHKAQAALAAKQMKK